MQGTKRAAARGNEIRVCGIRAPDSRGGRQVWKKEVLSLPVSELPEWTKPEYDKDTAARMRCCAAHLPTPPRLGTCPRHPRLAHPRTRTKSTRHRARRHAQPDRSRCGGRRGGGAVRAGRKNIKRRPSSRKSTRPHHPRLAPPRTRTKSTRHWRNHTRILAHTHPSASPHLPASLRGEGEAW